MSDEGLHEVHLNGKQLVFAFMTVTVIAVVVFLCGVMVGRGVPARSSPAVVSEVATGDPTLGLEAVSPVPASGSTDGAPVTSSENLTYTEQLTEDASPVDEVLRDATPATAKTRSPAPLTPAKVAPPSRRAAASESGAAAAPSGKGFVVQVVAVGKRDEADTISRRLAGKGYPAFVTTPGAGGPDVFRVRVGQYDSRREAESVANRLEKEEQFKPWITR